MRELENSILLQKGAYGVLAEAANLVGSTQIRNKATIGGNICYALLYADTPPALVALDAKAKIVGPRGVRIVPLEEIFVSIQKTVLQSDEVLTEIQLLNPPPHSGTAFLKIVRTGMDLAMVNVAVRVTLENTVCKKIRIAIGGGVGPKLVKPQKAEVLLRKRDYRVSY